MRILARHVAALILVLNAAFTIRAGDAGFGSPDFYPTAANPFGFRGDGSGQFPDATPPTKWSLTENVRWSKPVGLSYSSPILTDKFVFVTSEPNLLICIDRADGNILWKAETKPADLTDEKARKIAEDYEAPKGGSGMMAATPITDGTSVYVVLASGIVRALDMTGKQVWINYISAEQSTGYGRSASPLLVDGKLIVHMTNLYAFDAATGKELWMNKDAESTYGSPATMKLGGVSVIVTPAGDVMRADTGKTVVSGVGQGHNSTPLAKDGVVYFGESTVTANTISPAFKTQELWNSMIMGDVFGSPLLLDGTLLVVTAKGQLLTYDVKAKGDQNPLAEPRPLFGEDDGNQGQAAVAYSSLTLAGKFIFLNSTHGETVVLEATREAKQVARNTLKNGSGASPIFSGKEMFIRDGDKLFCIGK